MSISSECPVINAADPTLLAAIERSIATGFELLAQTMTELFTPPKIAVPEIIPNGSFTTPSGTVSMTDDSSNNIIWTDKNGNQVAYGLAFELFVAGAHVYVMGQDGNPYMISLDRSSGWEYFDVRAYNDLKSCALKIVTANPVTPPSA
jgi:hypothetical protein